MSQRLRSAKAAPTCTDACYLCGGSARRATFPYATRWNGRRFDYFECERCASTFVSPRPSAQEFDLMYDRGSYHDIHYTVTSDGEDHRQSLDFLEDYGPCGTRLLDFGCGNGAFLLAASRRGFDCHGVEQSESSIVGAAATSGVPITSFEEVERQGLRFDVIHLADVLEHLPDPAAIVRRLNGLLAADGLLYVEGPLERQRSLVFSFASALKSVRRRLGRDREGDVPPYHLTITSWRGQRLFFETALRHRLVVHQLYETGFPYPNHFELRAPPGRMLRSLIGSAAVKLARTALGKRLELANRFRAILQPQP